MTGDFSLFYETLNYNKFNINVFRILIPNDTEITLTSESDLHFSINRRLRRLRILFRSPVSLLYKRVTPLAALYVIRRTSYCTSLKVSGETHVFAYVHDDFFEIKLHESIDF